MDEPGTGSTRCRVTSPSPPVQGAGGCIRLNYREMSPEAEPAVTVAAVHQHEVPPHPGARTWRAKRACNPMSADIRHKASHSLTVTFPPRFRATNTVTIIASALLSLSLSLSAFLCLCLYVHVCLSICNLRICIANSGSLSQSFLLYIKLYRPTVNLQTF